MADFVHPRMPSFFQVILEDNLLQGKLNIPKNFARKYGDGILSSVKLEDPTGKVLNVGLTRSEGSMSFQSGWNEFTKHYSLKLGQFLVFRREGTGKFRVLIFELSASEIDYLKRSSRNGKGSAFDGKFKDPKLEEGVGVIDVKILPEILRCQEVRQKTPCFFQIILEDCLREGKLRIPRKFAREHGDGISRQVKLEDPTGAVWKVGLTKRAGSMWFRNGWKKFVKHYSIKLEYFLVFMLEGKSKFRVLIFDPSATEIDYPSRGRDCSLDGQSQEPEDNTDVNGAVDNLPFDEECSLKDPEAEQVPQMKREVDPIQRKNNAEAAFKSNNPYVIVSLQPSDVGKESGRLHLPNRFLEKHFTNFAGNVTLHSMDGRTWPAKYICNSIYGGWEAFVRGNGLVAGDDCLFQPIMGAEENSLKIAINPNPVDKGKGKRKRENSKQNQDLEKKSFTVSNAQRFKDPLKDKTEETHSINLTPHSFFSQNQTFNNKISSISHMNSMHPPKPPSFFKIMFSDFNLNMRIPPAFMKNFREGSNLRVPNVFKLKCEEKSWWVSSEKTKDGCFFVSGWPEFVKDRNLEMGDFLVFRLVKKSEFEVDVYGKTSCEKFQAFVMDEDHTPAEVVSGKGIAGKRRESEGIVDTIGTSVKRARKVSRMMKSSSVEIVMKHEINRYQILLPGKFARETGLKWRKEAVIKDPEGRIWHAKISVWKTGQAALSSGWKNLWIENGLNVGDTILLKFHGKEEEIELQISKTSN